MVYFMQGRASLIKLVLRVPAFHSEETCLAKLLDLLIYPLAYNFQYRDDGGFSLSFVERERRSCLRKSELKVVKQLSFCYETVTNKHWKTDDH